MKTRISKILGVMLSITMIASMFLFAAPVYAAPGDTEWVEEDEPGSIIRPGSDVIDYAVASATNIWALAGPQIQGDLQAVVTSDPWSDAVDATYNITYVDQDGVAGNVSDDFIIPADSLEDFAVDIVLEAGDTGVQLIEDVTVVVAGEEGDEFDIVGGRGYVFGSVDGESGDFNRGSIVGVFQSTNSGQSFTKIDLEYEDDAGDTVDAFELTGLPVSVAVAPDNPKVVAVLVNDLDVYTLYITTDDGLNWRDLDELVGVGMDVAVGPARSGLLLGREYFVALSDPDPGATDDGDIAVIGDEADWGTVSDEVEGLFDFTSVVVTPNYIGDRSIVTVGTPFDGPPQLLIINTTTGDIVGDEGIELDPDGETTDFDAAGADNSIISSDIALPSNFDPTSSGGQRSYVGIASVGSPADNDVYRVSSSASTDLDADIGAVKSVAYSGTVSSGKLFAGNFGPDDEDEADVVFTTNPQSGADWDPTEKAPSGVNDDDVDPAVETTGVETIVRVAADFATTNRVFAATSSDKSAFSISNDSGVSFNSEAFIDMPSDFVIQGMLLTPDGKTMYIATDDGEDIALWKAATPVSNSRWSRLLSEEGEEALIALNPDWDTSPTIFLFDRVESGDIYVSQNGGTTFATRMGPEATPDAVAVQDSQIVYLAEGSDVYKSTNAGWTWSEPEDSGIDDINNIIVPRFDDVIVAGDGALAWSTDGAANWDDDDAGLDGTGALRVAADTLYAGNKTVYLADEDGNGVFRYVINAGKAATAIIPGGTFDDEPFVAIVTGNNAVYALGDDFVARSLNPLQTTGVDWTSMDEGDAPDAGVFLQVASTKTENTVYAANGEDKTIWGFKDWLAVSMPELTSPVDKATVAVDPVNGRSEPITIAFKQMGSGTGLVTEIEVEIREKSQGLSGDPTGAIDIPTATAPSIRLNTAEGDLDAASEFRPNTEYVWSIRASLTENGEDITSKWTAARTFGVQSGGVVEQPHAGPIITSPQGGAMNVDPKLVAITWAPVSGATEYTVIVATDSALTKTIGGTPAMVTTTAFQVAGLDNATTYFYSVQATKPTVGPAGIGSFTTAAKPAPTPTPTPPAPPTTPVIVFPPQPTPAYVWAIIVIGGVLILAVIILIVRTRRVP